MTSPTLRLGPLPPLQISPGTLITVLLLAVLLYPTFSRGPATPTGAVLLSVGMGLVMIASVLAHEGAHAGVARAFGAEVDHIALTLFGGHTQYRAREMSTLGSLLVSLAGPAANAVLAAVGTLAALLTAPGSAADAFLSVGAWMNLVLALFNLLPGLPMDGGRAVETLAGAVLRNPARGTRITAWIGRAIAVAIVLVPLWQIIRSGGAGTLGLLTLVWALVIAGMLWQGASRALQQAQLDQRITALDAGRLARPVRIVPGSTPLAALDGADLEQLLILEREGGGQDSGPRLGRALRPDPTAAAAVPGPHRRTTAVRAVAGPVGEVVALPAHLRGDALIQMMLSHPAPVYLVLEADGRPRGVILSSEVNALLRGR